jgi:hypothetical protein
MNSEPIASVLLAGGALAIATLDRFDPLSTDSACLSAQ